MLFRLRQQEGTQARPALAAASLLAKKLAAGVQVAGLDARVAKHGNFGVNLAEAQQSAEIFCGAALQLGLIAVVFLTDASLPFQPFVGRGEALTAVAKVVSGTIENEWLEDHARMCLDMSKIVESHALPRTRTNEPHVQRVGIASAMSANLRAQGSSSMELEAYVSHIESQNRQQICATENGFVHYNLQMIRDLLLALTKTASRGMHTTDRVGEYPDVAGIRLLCHPEREVRRGEIVLELRGSTTTTDPSGLFSIRSMSAGAPNTIEEVVTQ
ncbi:hypothetical protein JVX93_16480 [Mycolicibacterium boenickei]|nr:hypothetical protein JVX93_16480 [Mycolicibacterium boenickei]